MRGYSFEYLFREPFFFPVKVQLSYSGVVAGSLRIYSCMVETLCISLLAGSILVFYTPFSTDDDGHDDGGDFICMALVFISFLLRYRCYSIRCLRGFGFTCPQCSLRAALMVGSDAGEPISPRIVE